MARRAERFTINASHPLANGLIFAGLQASLPGSLHYHDSSLRQVHGTLQNMATTDWLFDEAFGRWVINLVYASSQFVLAGRTGYAPPLTLAVWVYKTDFTTAGYMISCGSAHASNDTYSIAVDEGEQIKARAKSTIVGDATITGYPAVSEWHHVAAVFETTASRYAFLDGARSAQGTTSITPTEANIDRTLIGRRGGASTTYCDARIGDPMIWDRALSDGELAILANRADPHYAGLLQPVRRPVFFRPPAVSANVRRRAMHHYKQMQR